MIPEFPKFKTLELEDRGEVEAITRRHPPYSDFDFGSMWAWDVQGLIRLSILDRSLVVRFSDYLTGEPFYSFLGTEKIVETATKLFDFLRAQGDEARLRLVPESCAAGVDSPVVVVAEDRDGFDYIYDLREYDAFRGGGLASARNQFNQFVRCYAQPVTIELNLRDARVQADILDLYARRTEAVGLPLSNEPEALRRFLKSSGEFRHVAVGVAVEDFLVGVSISLHGPNGLGNCLFAKADTNYRGVYAFLMHATARHLLRNDIERLNYEQDLGLPNLRLSKMAFKPAAFLKKYDLSPAPVVATDGGSSGGRATAAA